MANPRSNRTRITRITKNDLTLSIFGQKGSDCWNFVFKKKTQHCKLWDSGLWAILHVVVNYVVMWPTSKSDWLLLSHTLCQSLPNSQLFQFASISGGNSSNYCFQIFANPPDLTSLRHNADCPDSYWKSMLCLHRIKRSPMSWS
jgi:hypothetical protein